MWSGGRSLKSIAAAGWLLSSLGTATGQTPLCGGQHPGNPELISGAASCFYNEAAGQTLIDLGQSSVIRWENLGLSDPASRLSFRSAAGPGVDLSVINRVEGPSLGRPVAETIAGTLEFQDGYLVVTHPRSMLTISGSVQARSVVMATHQLDAGMEQELLDGNAADFTGANHPLNVVGASVVATDGDVVLAGRVVLHSANAAGDDAALLAASQGSVRIFGGENFRLLPSGSERLQELPGSSGGSVISSKTIRAGQAVEIAARESIENAGLIEANGGSGQVYLRVSDTAGGLITNAGSIRGMVDSEPPVSGPGQVVGPDEGDAPSGLSTGISRFPVVGRPGEKPSTRTVVVYESAPVTGSASAQRERLTRSAQRSGSSRRVASTTRGSGSEKKSYLARGRSFFGLRGGAGAGATKKER